MSLKDLRSEDREQIVDTVQGINGTLITDTTPQTIIAAPGAGKALRVRKIVASNPTGAQSPEITLDSGTTAILRFLLGDPAVSGQGHREFNFSKDHPLELGVNEALTGEAHAAVGDTTVFVTADIVTV